MVSMARVCLVVVTAASLAGAAVWAQPAADASAVTAVPAPWPDTPATREFRQRVLYLAVLYGESSGLDSNGYLIETKDLGAVGSAGCHRVQAHTSLGGVRVADGTFEVCKH